MKPKRSLLHRMFSRPRWRWLQRLTRVRRIHHPRWSYGWAFPLTTLCWFEPFTATDWFEGREKTFARGWQRCERGSYHDCTTTGRY